MSHKKVKEICKPFSSSILINKMKNNNGDYPLWGAKGLVKNIDTYQQDRPYISIVKWGAGVGRVEIRPEKTSIVATMQGIIPNPDIDIRWLSNALKFLHLENFATKATVPNLYFRDYGEAFIRVPSLTEQKYISDVLEKIEINIEKKRHIINVLDNLIKARFVEMFGDKNFGARPFKDVCDELFAGGDVKKDRTVNEADSDHPYAVFTNGEKDGGLYGYTDIARVIKPSITISGRGTIGFCLVRTEPFYPAIRLIVATPKENLVTPSYLKYFIDSKDYNGRGASIPQLTIPMIKDEPVPIPPIELQNQFETLIAQVDKSKFALSNELAMGDFYVRLIYDRIMHGCINL